MAVRYPLQQVGVLDGTKLPPNKADGREVNTRKFAILASKQSGDAWNNGDTVRLGKKPAGQKITRISIATDTSLGSATVSIGTAAAATKYVNAATLTTPLNVPVNVGPLASTLDDAPGDAEELIATIGAANIAGAALLTVEIEMAGIG